MLTDTDTGSHPLRATDSESAIGGESPRTSLRLSALTWQLPLSAVVATVVSLAFQWCVTRLPLSADSAGTTAWLHLSGAVLVTGVVALVAVRRWSAWATPLSWCGLSALGTLPLTLPLAGTPFYLFGVSGDQFFRTQYLTRLTESAALADGNYAGLPPFYPAGWFWLGGRFANLADLSGWEAYKPWAIVTMAVAPVLAFVLWTAVVRRPVALLMAALTGIVGLRIAAYEPYSWVLVAVLIPITVILLQNLRNLAVHGRGNGWGPAVLAGLGLGACGAVYTLLAGFFALLLAGLGVYALVARRWAGHERTDEAAVPGSRWVVERVLARLVVAGAVAAPLVLLVWWPYLLRVLDESSVPSSAALHFLPKIAAFLPTPMAEFSVAGLACLIGTVWIVWAWRYSDTARALGLLTAGCYLWYLASTLALSAGTTLLAFRLEPLLLGCLFCAGGLGSWELLRWLGQHFGEYRAALRRTAFALALVAMVTLTWTAPDTLKHAVTPGLFSQAYATYDATGHRASGPPDPADGGAWNDEVITTIGALSGKAPQDLVVLTSAWQLLAFAPYHGFQTVNPPYANPLADYEERRLLVESWARSGSAEELLSALDRSRFTPPTVFVFARSEDGLHISVSRETFPRSPNFEVYDVVFPERLFEHPRFVRRDVGPYTIIARH